MGSIELNLYISVNQQKLGIQKECQHSIRSEVFMYATGHAYSVIVFFFCKPQTSQHSASVKAHFLQIRHLGNPLLRMKTRAETIYEEILSNLMCIQ